MKGRKGNRRNGVRGAVDTIGDRPGGAGRGSCDEGRGRGEGRRELVEGSVASWPADTVQVTDAGTVGETVTRLRIWQWRRSLAHRHQPTPWARPQRTPACRVPGRRDPGQRTMPAEPGARIWLRISSRAPRPFFVQTWPARCRTTLRHAARCMAVDVCDGYSACDRSETRGASGRAEGRSGRGSLGRSQLGQNWCEKVAGEGGRL